MGANRIYRMDRIGWIGDPEIAVSVHLCYCGLQSEVDTRWDVGRTQRAHMQRGQGRQFMASSERQDLPERVASVETAIEYLAQAQVDSNARFDRAQADSNARSDRLEAKVDRILFTIIAVGAAIFAAVIASNWLG